MPFDTASASWRLSEQRVDDRGEQRRLQRLFDCGEQPLALLKVLCWTGHQPHLHRARPDRRSQPVGGHVFDLGGGQSLAD